MTACGITTADAAAWSWQAGQSAGALGAGWLLCWAGIENAASALVWTWVCATRPCSRNANKASHVTQGEGAVRVMVPA